MLPGEENGPSLVKLALNFFNFVMQRATKILERYHDLNCVVFRKSMLPLALEKPPEIDSELQLIQCKTKLWLARIKFRKRRSNSF